MNRDWDFVEQVILDIRDGKYRISTGAKRVGISQRHFRRLVARYRAGGRDAILPKNAGNPGTRQSRESLNKMLEIIDEYYWDFSGQHISEKLFTEHGFKISAETIRKRLYETGRRQPREKTRRPPQPLRDRRPKRGELVQVDGSPHPWLEKRAGSASALVFIDDATSEILHIRFVKSETTLNYMIAIDEYVRKNGRPLALYCDMLSVFRNNAKNTKEEPELTQFGKAMRRIGIELIYAQSAPAKGRVERCNGVLQDRLVKEMRLANISDYDAANEFVLKYIAAHNVMFAEAPEVEGDTHRPMEDLNELHAALVWSEYRRLSQGLQLHYNKVIFTLVDTKESRKLAGLYVEVVEHPDGQVEIMHKGTSYDYVIFDKMRRSGQGETVGSKRLDAAIEYAKILQAEIPHHRKRNRKGPVRESENLMFPDAELDPRGRPLKKRGRPRKYV